MKKFLKHLFVFMTYIQLTQASEAECPKWLTKKQDLKNKTIKLCVPFSHSKIISKMNDYFFVITQNSDNEDLTVNIFSIPDLKKAEITLIYQQTDLGIKLNDFKNSQLDVKVAFGDFTKSEAFHFAILTQQESSQTLIMKKFVEHKFQPVGFKYQIDQQWVSVPTLIFQNQMAVTIEHDSITGKVSDQTTSYELRLSQYVRR